MKRLSEVCKIVGVTRRTLQEYNKIGLLSPSEITEGGYWLYDDFAISKLSLIQVFIRLGYARKDIKEILDNPGLNLLEEYQIAIIKLTERKQEIDGMINYLRTQMILHNMPEQFLHRLLELDAEDLLGNKSVSDSISFTTKKLSGIENLDDESLQPFIALGMMIAGIAFFRNHEVSSDEVQSYIDDLYDYYLRMIIETEEDLTETEKKELIEEKNNPDFLGTIIDTLIDYLSEEECYKSMNENYGPGAVSFAIDALNYYRKSKGGIRNE